MPSTKHGRIKTAGGLKRLYLNQKVATDLVGSMLETSKGNKWTISPDDKTLAIPHGSVPVMSTAVHKKAFCYLGFPERSHTDQEAQFEFVVSAVHLLVI